MMESRTNKQRNVVFYGRVSTEHEAQVNALENQLDWYNDLAKQHTNWNVVGRYIDEGITGTQAKKRPSFIRMIEDSKKNEFDLIVTREVCRFARNTVDALTYTRDLLNRGIEVYFVNDNIWTNSGEGELRLTIMATMAQEESRKVSERVLAGQYISRKNGVLYGNGNILGYDRVGDTYVINPEQAETIRMIFDMYVNKKMGFEKIARELDHLQRKTSMGKVKWSQSQVSRIIKNSTYKGVMAYGKSHTDNYLNQKRTVNLDSDTFEYKQGNFEAIIPEDLWNKAQAIKESKMRRTIVDGKEVRKGAQLSDDVWMHKLKCRCGSAFRKNKWRTNKKTGENVFGYQCYNQVNYGSKKHRIEQGLSTDGFCDIKMIADWKLELMAKYIITALWKNKSKIINDTLEMISSCYSDDEPKFNDKAVKAEIQQCEAKIDHIIDMRLDGEITKEEAARMRAKFDKRIAILKAELEKAENHETDKMDMERRMTLVRKSLESIMDTDSPTISHDVIEILVKQITPIDDNHFEWTFNFLDEKYIVSASGRRKNFAIFGDNFSPTTCGSNTSCYTSREGVNSSVEDAENGIDLKLDCAFCTKILTFTINFEDALAFRKSLGKYLRKSQWQDLTITIIF